MLGVRTGTFKKLKSFFSSGENGRNTKREKNVLQTMDDSELIRRYRLDRAGIVFVSDLIREKLTSRFGPLFRKPRGLVRVSPMALIWKHVIYLEAAA